MPNLLGILFLVTLTAALFAILIILFLFAGTTIYYKVVMFSNFIVLCNLWIVIIFLSGMKAYNRILITMLFGYSVMIGASFLLNHWKIYGLLSALLIGHSTLLFVFFSRNLTLASG